MEGDDLGLIQGRLGMRSGVPPDLFGQGGRLGKGYKVADGLGLGCLGHCLGHSLGRRLGRRLGSGDHVSGRAVRIFPDITIAVRQRNLRRAARFSVIGGIRRLRFKLATALPLASGS